jgi:hypothetical protein
MVGAVVDMLKAIEDRGGEGTKKRVGKYQLGINRKT